MSKEYIQALERIKTKIIIETEIRVNKELCVANPYYNDYLIVQQALQRLESIDNANPTEALKCLERIDNTLCLNNIKGKLEFGIDTEEHTDCDSVIGMTDDLETIKQALLKTQEQEKELERYKVLEKELKSEINVLFSYMEFTKLFFEIFNLNYSNETFTLSLIPNEQYNIENVDLKICLIKEDADKIIKVAKLLEKEAEVLE